jgi:hypothetical protein
MESYCKNQYYLYKDDFEQRNKNYTKQIISSLASGITVGTTLYLLNKKQKKVK